MNGDVNISPQDLFAKLESYYGENVDLNAALALLSWDQETYMPHGAAVQRARQIKTLSGLTHRHFTDPLVGKMLDGLERLADDLTPLQRRALSELRYDYDREVKVPESLVRELAEAQSVGMESWKIAREKSDFAVFRPHLDKLLDLKRRLAEIWGFQDSPYDALHDTYEKGSTAAKIRPVFARVRKRLVPLLARIKEAAHQPSREILRRAYNPDRQWDFTMRVLADMGFDFEHGRQDKSVHPFTMGIGPDDTRLTTRISPDDFATAIGSTIHEAGHGLYDQGLSPDRVGVILAEAPSLGIHESQSRLWENIVGRSEAFWNHYHEPLLELFPEALSGVEPRALFEAMNVVRPSLIRVEADEVTYNLHIVIRFELELALIEGDLAVADLPRAWNDRYEEYLGIRPENDADGCLQDIHWSMGAFGYFPTYTLGNLYSVPFFEAARRDLPELSEEVTPERMKELKTWLNENVHQQGRSENAEEISRRLTGEPLQPDPFLDYLDRKYGELYRLT